jgi:hypothetical protein
MSWPILLGPDAPGGLGAVEMVAEPVSAAAYFTDVLGHDVPIGSRSSSTTSA